MIVTLFRSRLRDDAGAAYEKDAARMETLARAMPGFVSFETLTGADGTRLSVVVFESEVAQRAWREHPEHRAAQLRGRERYYAFYEIRVLSLLRESTFGGAKSAS